MNYYDILEVSPRASNEVIRAAYKSLIQRYHPDKNPGDTAAANRATQVVQAYEVLSDGDKRAAYDLQCNSPIHAPIETYRATHHSLKQTDKSNKSNKPKKSNYGYVWIIITVIMLSGGGFLVFSKKSLSPTTELTEARLLIEKGDSSEAQKQTAFKRAEDILSQHPEIRQAEAAQAAQALASRTVELWNSGFTVQLRALDGTAHALTLPVLQVRVGTFDAGKVLAHVETQKQFIREQLATRLAQAKYEALTSAGGERYLNTVVLDALDEILGTHRLEDYPTSTSESPGRYGPITVLLPEAFALTP
jgi:flagellar basal body-associated protein FliL